MVTRRRGDLRLTDNEVGGWKFSEVNNLTNFKFPKIGGKEDICSYLTTHILGVKNVILLKHYNSYREKSSESKY